MTTLPSRVCASETKRWTLQLCSSHVSPPAQRHCPWMTAPRLCRVPGNKDAGCGAQSPPPEHPGATASSTSPASLQGPQALPLLRAAPILPSPSLPMPLRLL